MQDVVFKGTTYSNVPAINLPNTSGGTSKFVDVTDTTANAGDVASGKYFYNSLGVKTAGTNSGDGSSSGTDTSDATITSGAQMLKDVTAYDANGNKVTGTIVSRSSSDLTASGATVTVPAGNYASQATKSVSSGSASTPATTITANPTITVSSAGLITASVSGSQNITPTVSAGYVSSGTAGTVTVSGSDTEQLTVLGATTYNTSSTDRIISNGRYLTGTQTIKAVTVSGLSASNIASGVTVKVGDANDDDRIASVTGTLSFVTYYTGSSTPSSSTGSNGDIYLQTS